MKLNIFVPQLSHLWFVKVYRGGLFDIVVKPVPHFCTMARRHGEPQGSSCLLGPYCVNNVNKGFHEKHNGKRKIEWPCYSVTWARNCPEVDINSIISIFVGKYFIKQSCSPSVLTNRIHILQLLTNVWAAFCLSNIKQKFLQQMINNDY